MAIGSCGTSTDTEWQCGSRGTHVILLCCYLKVAATICLNGNVVIILRKSGKREEIRKKNPIFCDKKMCFLSVI